VSDSKAVSAEQAVALIPAGSTVLVDGSGGGVNEPALLLRALEERFLADGSPSDLTIVHPSGMGDGRGGGIARVAHPGLVRRVIGGHWSWSREMQQLASDEAIEAYCLPQGVLSHLLRNIAGRGPGLLTHVGLGTFVDPRLEGGRLNERTTEELVELVEIGGREWLLYRTLDIDVALIRGTRADERGNIVMDEEGLYAETLSAAQAAKNCGGIVIAQVREMVPAGTLDPRIVKVPGLLVDAVVVDPEQRLSVEVERDLTLVGARKAATDELPRLPLSHRKVIARRAAQELREGDVINLGFGVPDGVASILAEEDMLDHVTFTVEQGHVGGVPATGADFGLARNQEAMVDAGYQFDWYDGGGLDVAILSFAEVDAAGNVNVSKFGGRIAGVGGFINISQGARRVVFVGSLTAGRLDFGLGPSGLEIRADGTTPKFVPEVEQISFSAEYARRWERPVTYVTERATFELGEHGPVLVEIAPGVDLERDVFGRMGFRPEVSPDLRVADAAIFDTPPFGLRLGEGAGALA
jgi:propionate CoA-transferase